MAADLIDTRDPRWSMLLRSTVSDFYQLPGYVDVAAAHEQGEARGLYVEDPRGRLLLPIILRPIGDGLRDATSPQGYPGFMIEPASDPGFLRDAFNAIVGRLREEDVVSLYVRLHPLLNPDPPDGVGEVVRHPDTVCIDLSLSSEELWSQTRPRFRSQINRARRGGHHVSVETSSRSLATFMTLYRMTMQRLGASPAYRYSDAYFRGLSEIPGDALHVAIVSVRGEPAAAGLYVEGAGIVHLHLAGSDPRFDRQHPTKLMYHHMRAWARERGDRWLHLGGGRGTADDSLLHFKAGFSPLRTPYRTLRVVVDESAYDTLVAGRFGGCIPGSAQGYFPLYRAPAS